MICFGLGYNVCLVNVCWTNEWMNEYIIVRYGK